MKYTLPALPFGEDDLAPVVSKKTISYHYGKHTKAYFDNLNKLIETSPLNGKPLVEIIKNSDGAIFNNAAQIYNHNFFFSGMCPNCNTQIPQEIVNVFGGEQKFKDEFKSAATILFGSGYTWLVLDGDTLKIVNLKDAETPMVYDMKPILTLDVWEHSYYLDYKNKRADFVDAFLNNLVDWNFERLKNSARL